MSSKLSTTHHKTSTFGTPPQRRRRIMSAVSVGGNCTTPSFLSHAKPLGSAICMENSKHFYVWILRSIQSSRLSGLSTHSALVSHIEGVSLQTSRSLLQSSVPTIPSKRLESIFGPAFVSCRLGSAGDSFLIALFRSCNPKLET